MRRTIATLRRVVKGDLAIQFVPPGGLVGRIPMNRHDLRPGVTMEVPVSNTTSRP